MIRIGVLVSGSGTNLQAILDACTQGRIDGHVSIVISNKPDAYALKRAQALSIPTHVVTHREYPDRQQFDAELSRILKNYDVDLVCLAGFMRILSPDFIQAFAGRIMNIHPSLLPAFPGLNVRQAAIDHGVRFSGCTVHFVDLNVDNGPIIIQAVVPVFPDDTEEDLNQRILKQEHQIYPRAVQLYADGRITVSDRKVIIRDYQKESHLSMINPPLSD